MNTLKNENKTDTTFKYLSDIQNNLIKNYSNPVFSNSDKNKLLEKYSKIKNIGESIYKFKTLKQNNFNAEAQNEKENTSNLVLKGGISNYKYVWHSENSDTTCDECSDLDGQEFDFEDEVPERPHPNCQCTVEIIEYNDENEEPDDEPCDCMDSIKDEFNLLISEAEELGADLNNMLSNLLEQLKTKAGQLYETACQKIIDEAATWDNAIGDFARNYNDMVEANTIGGDKYFHSKANCEATQRGGAGEDIAEAMSLLREIEEGTRKVVFEGEDLITQIEDANRDMEANEYGRNQGKDNPNVDCEILIEILRPRGLPDKY